MKKLFLYIAVGLSMAMSLTSCEVFGLDLQEPYDFDSEIGKHDNRVNMSVWDFMNSRTDIFSQMLEAIKYAGIEPEFYQKSNCTYLLLTNTALSSATATDRSFWHENPYMLAPDDPDYVADAEDPSVNQIIPTSWEEIPRQTVKDMLMYHVIKNYELSFDELTKLTKGVNSFFPTFNENNMPMAIEMQKEGALSLYFNNFDTHYKLKLKPRTSNLYSTVNNSYMHVMDGYVQYPDDFALSNIPFFEK